MNQNDQYLETRDAAQYLRYSESHFRALVRAGKVPRPVRVSNKLLWRQSLLDAHMRALEVAQGVIPPTAA
jgi:predicted DNA-binding transcriptional regulator AlpA